MGMSFFVGAHVVLAVVLIVASLLAARLSPALKERLARLHRPSLRHVAVMLLGAMVSAGLVHLIIHGGLA